MSATTTATPDTIILTSRYGGTCAVCLAAFPVGTRIMWSPSSKATMHDDERLCARMHAERAAQAAPAVADRYAEQMLDDDRYMAEMEMAADRAWTERDNMNDLAWEIAQEYASEAARDLAADERDAEREMEHRMNCDDPDCLAHDARRDPPAELDAEYDRICAAADRLLDEYDAGLRARNLAGLSRGRYRVSLDGKRDSDFVNLSISPNRRDQDGIRFGAQGVGVGYVTGAGVVGTWSDIDLDAEEIRRVVAAVNILLGAADPSEYGKAYARLAGVCYRCSQPLSQEDSLDRMMGPVCYKKMLAGER